MPDLNDILQQLAVKTGDKQMVDRVRAALSTPNAHQAAQMVSSQNADDLERAAQAAQRGDMAEAARLANKLMQTNEGAKLAGQLRQMLFPK